MKRIIFSNHAAIRCLERDISQETARLIIETADYTKRVSEEKMIAVKMINDRKINVVYVEKDKYIKVVTVY